MKTLSSSELIPLPPAHPVTEKGGGMNGPHRTSNEDAELFSALIERGEAGKESSNFSASAGPAKTGEKEPVVAAGGLALAPEDPPSALPDETGLAGRVFRARMHADTSAQSPRGYEPQSYFEGARVRDDSLPRLQPAANPMPAASAMADTGENNTYAHLAPAKSDTDGKLALFKDKGTTADDSLTRSAQVPGLMFAASSSFSATQAQSRIAGEPSGLTPASMPDVKLSLPASGSHDTLAQAGSLLPQTQARTAVGLPGTGLPVKAIPVAAVVGSGPATGAENTPAEDGQQARISLSDDTKVKPAAAFQPGFYVPRKENTPGSLPEPKEGISAQLKASAESGVRQIGPQAEGATILPQTVPPSRHIMAGVSDTVPAPHFLSGQLSAFTNEATPLNQQIGFPLQPKPEGTGLLSVPTKETGGSAAGAMQLAETPQDSGTSKPLGGNAVETPRIAETALPKGMPAQPFAGAELKTAYLSTPELLPHPVSGRKEAMTASSEPDLVPEKPSALADGKLHPSFAEARITAALAGDEQGLKWSMTPPDARSATPTISNPELGKKLSDGQTVATLPASAEKVQPYLDEFISSTRSDYAPINRKISARVAENTLTASAGNSMPQPQGADMPLAAVSELSLQGVIGAERAQISGVESSAQHLQAGNAHRANGAASLGHQLAISMPDAPNKPIEVTLAPEELGKIRMTLHTNDGSITVSLQAERPDTLDLMRRNIDSLMRDFRDLGYSQISFDFGDRTSERQMSQEQPEPPSPSETEISPKHTPAPQAVLPASGVALGGLDLRM